MKDFKGLTRSEIINLLKKDGLQSFRGDQIFNWLYQNGAENFSEMTNLSKDLRAELNKRYALTDLQLKQKYESIDGTKRYLWELADGESLESVYLPYERQNRHSVCISTQVGCPLSCSFCATGFSGYVRDLTAAEIVDQVVKIQADISQKEFGTPRISNVVFMGMGEPLLNLNNVLKAVTIMNDSDGLNIGMRKMTISTAGYEPGIRQLAEENDQIGLAVSLHAPTDKLRNKIMPINQKFNLKDLLAAVNEYIDTTHRRVTFEYVLMEDINDDPHLAEKLSRLLKGINCHVNLIPANPVADLSIKRPEQKVIDKFYDILSRNHLSVTLRREMGTDIQAACGQLKRSSQ